ncbi:MAG: serine/threonine protein kinase [Ignavibacteriaceae bacterium]|nr:serine/threonine protein kinase [Ignavibacteriaceae bacterium]
MPEIIFDKFEIIECLKKDEHSAVYLANHVFLSKKIILKSLNTETIPQKESAGRFKREAKILAKLDHLNIIKVLDFGTWNEFFYISFEYFESRNLREVLRENRLSLEQKKNLISQLLAGLDYAHSNNVIHRDLKPENILIDKNYNLKIGDFGLALTSDDVFSTSQNSVLGTPAYMSPEQISGEKLTNRSDLFSAGLIIYEILLNKNPLAGRSINESINNILRFDENDIFSSISDLPGNLNQLLRGLLRKNPEERIQTADKALRFLGQAVGEFSGTKSKNYFYWIAAAVFVVIIVSFFFINNFYQKSKSKFNQSNGKSTSSIAPEKNPDAEVISKQNDKPEDISKRESKIPDAFVRQNITSSEPEKNPDQILKEGIEIGYGFVSVECYPWAEIFIDSEKVETTPLSQSIKLKTGEYEIKLVNPSYPEYKKQIKVVSNQTVEINVNLELMMGFLICEVYPWGEIFINDRQFSVTPLQNPIKLIPGKYKLEIKNPSFESKKQEINIIKGDTLVFRYNFYNGK